MTAPSRQAVEAALEAWYTTPTDYVFETKPEADARQMLAAITAAMPHLLAVKEAEIAALRSALKAVDLMRDKTLFISGSATIWTLKEWKRHRDAALETSGGVK